MVSTEKILKKSWLFDQIYCCGFWQQPQQYIKILFKNHILIYSCGSWKKSQQYILSNIKTLQLGFLISHPLTYLSRFSPFQVSFILSPSQVSLIPSPSHLLSRRCRSSSPVFVPSLTHLSRRSSSPKSSRISSVAGLNRSVSSSSSTNLKTQS